MVQNIHYITCWILVIFVPSIGLNKLVIDAFLFNNHPSTATCYFIYSYVNEQQAMKDNTLLCLQISHHILSHLNSRALLSVTAVCRQWRAVTHGYIDNGIANWLCSRIAQDTLIVFTPGSCSKGVCTCTIFRIFWTKIRKIVHVHDKLCTCTRLLNSSMVYRERALGQRLHACLPVNYFVIRANL